MSIKTFKTGRLILSFLGIFGVFLVISCESGDEELGLSLEDNQLSTIVVDTFSTEIGTVFIDSITTSLAENLIAGHIAIDEIGQVHANSYFELSLSGIDANGDNIEDFLVEPSTTILDSLVFIIEKGEYWYGDTTSELNLSLHRVTEVMQHANTDFLYNSSSFEYENEPLASFSSVYTDPFMRFTVNETFTNELFELIYDADNSINTNEAFKNYFRGVAIVSSENNERIISFTKNIVMRTYYHRSEDLNIHGFYDFSLKSTDVSFNSIDNDRSGSDYESLSNRFDEISLSETNGESVLLSGTDLLVKVNFPTIHKLLEDIEPHNIEKAELFVYPDPDSFDRFIKLPEQLGVYRTDRTNNVGDIVRFDFTAASQLVAPEINWELKNETYYKFSITDFIIESLENELFNGEGLMLAPPLNKTIERVDFLKIKPQVNNKNSSFKLVIYLIDDKL